MPHGQDEAAQPPSGSVISPSVSLGARADRLPSWKRCAQLAAPFLAGAAAVAVYGPVVAGLAQRWWSDPDYSHGLVCAPLALVFAARRRRAVLTLPRAPRIAGAILAAVGLLLLVIGRLGAELFLARISLPVFLSGAVVFLLGWHQLRALLLPLVLLLVAIPLPAIVVTEVSVPLQFVASAAAERLLNGSAVPVLRDGNVLVLPNATLQVAEACSGVRSLATLLALSILLARGTTTSVVARVLIVLAAIPAAVAVNALRVAITAVGTYWYGSRAAEGVAHEAVGLLMFIVALAIVGTWGRLLRRFDLATADARASS